MAVLAERLGIPKSSVHAAFGSKQDLQLAVLSETRTILIDHVVVPSLVEAVGNARLVAVGESWIGYLQNEIFKGGCVLSSAASEMDGRPGPVRDALMSTMSEWLKFLADNARAAMKKGEFSANADAEQLAFQLHSVGLTANWHHQLFGGASAFKRARTAWNKTLESARP
jgi:AcrR family transcriptional regulator